MSDELHPLDAGLMELGQPKSGLEFPPSGWKIIQPWGVGFALVNRDGLRVLIDCGLKEDERWWVHVSLSRERKTPTHLDMAVVKRDFLGERYAYSVWPPSDVYVNIHPHCLHIWALVDDKKGQLLPEFSDILPGIGRSI